MIKKTSQTEHQGFLDGVRGAAALYVLVAHCTIWGGGMDLPNPKIAVDVFMVLSGYLMMHLTNLRAAKEPPGTLSSALDFWIRRFFRIAPVYYLCLVAAFLLVNQVEAGARILQSQAPERWANTVYYVNGPLAQRQLHFSISNLLAHVSFVFGLLPAYCNSVTLPDWSIGLEMQFYALFPFTLMLGRRFGLLQVIAAFWIFGIAARHLIQHYFGPSLFPEPSFLPLKLQFFLVGMLIANAVFRFKSNPTLGSVELVLALVIASTMSRLIAFLAGLIFFLGMGHNIGDLTILSTLRTQTGRLLGNRITRFMADVSYGVYLVHGFFISIFGGWLYSQPFAQVWSPMHRLLFLAGVTVIGAYGVAFLAHILVERPGINLGRAILSRLNARKGRSLFASHAPGFRHEPTLP